MASHDDEIRWNEDRPKSGSSLSHLTDAELLRYIGDVDHTKIEKELIFRLQSRVDGADIIIEQYISTAGQELVDEAEPVTLIEALDHKRGL